jgi:hypothetical protein
MSNPPLAQLYILVTSTMKRVVDIVPLSLWFFVGEGLRPSRGQVSDLPLHPFFCGTMSVNRFCPKDSTTYTSVAVTCSTCSNPYERLDDSGVKRQCRLRKSPNEKHQALADPDGCHGGLR